MGKHVVIGSGPVGTATARLLAARGERVSVVTRSGGGPVIDGVELVRADAGDSESLARIARGAEALYNCANPPYVRWAAQWPPLAASILSAAEASGAVLATVSNLYGYGSVSGPMTEDLPLNAQDPKGRVRARMWLDALASHEAGRARVTEVRASDYVGAGSQSHLGKSVVSRVLTGKTVQVNRSADAAHSWTYVGDVARTLVAAAASPAGWGRAWHVPTAAPRSQREAIADIARVAGLDAAPRVTELSPAMLRMLARVSPYHREYLGIEYQFTEPFVIDSSAATEQFGIEATPWEDVLAEVVECYSGRSVVTVAG